MENEHFSLLCVDDDENILKALKRTFFDKPFTVYTAISGKDGLDILNKEKIDLIISDYRMAEMNGIEFLKKAKEMAPDVARIMLTGYSDIEVTIAAINEGAIHKYLTKPWDNNTLISVILEILSKQGKHIGSNTLKVEDNNFIGIMPTIKKTLEKANIGTIKALMSTIELKSKYMRGHCERVMMYSSMLMNRLKLDEKTKEDLKYAALLHDIGKISIPIAILDKQGTLTPEERKLIEQHPINGASITMEIDFLSNSARIILEHHEQYNGKGYPHGIKGNDLLQTSKILAVADVYDSITSERSYRSAMTNEQAVNFLKNEKEKMFDPEIVDNFIEELIKRKI